MHWKAITWLPVRWRKGMYPFNSSKRCYMKIQHLLVSRNPVYKFSLFTFLIRRLNQAFFIPFFFFFCSVFIQKYIQNSFKHQIDMISTKSICKCRKTYICCTTFCAEACSLAVKVTDTENVDGSEKMTDKICH